jgi:hypothetical protein
MLIVVIASRNWKMLRSFFTTGLILLLASSFVIGWRAVVEFPRSILRYSHVPPSLNGEMPDEMANLRGVAAHLFDSHTLQVAFVAVATIASVLLLCWLCSRPAQPAAFALLVVVTILASYHGYIYDLVLLALVPPLLFAEARERGHSAALLGCGGALAAILFVPFASHGLNIMAFYLSIALAALAIALTMRLRREQFTV